MRSFSSVPFTNIALCLNLLWPTGALDVNEATSIVSITQTMNLYSHLIDTGESAHLGRVFADNATADFNLTGMSVAHGLPAIIEHVDSLSNVTSQHALTTNYIEMLSKNVANASTELVATFFGSGKQVGEIYVAYGTYNTEWQATVRGWRITYLAFAPTGAWGNVSVNYPGGAP